MTLLNLGNTTHGTTGEGDVSNLVFNFLSAFERGAARPNRYRVEFNLPQGLSGSSAQANSIGINGDALASNIRRMQQYFQGQISGPAGNMGSINIKCEHATFPQRSMMTYEHRQNSAPFRLPYSSAYDPVTFSFYSDSDLDTRDYFDVWQSVVSNFTTNTMNFYNEYVSDIKIYQMDIQGNDTYSVSLFESWPINVGSFEVSYGQFDTVTITNVTMAYKYWQPKWFNDGNGSVQRSAG